MRATGVAIRVETPREEAAALLRAGAKQELRNAAAPKRQGRGGDAVCGSSGAAAVAALFYGRRHAELPLRRLLRKGRELGHRFAGGATAPAAEQGQSRALDREARTPVCRAAQAAEEGTRMRLRWLGWAALAPVRYARIHKRRPRSVPLVVAGRTSGPPLGQRVRRLIAAKARDLGATRRLLLQHEEIMHRGLLSL